MNAVSPPVANSVTLGAVDCDIHPGVPGIKALLPYMDDHWRDHFVRRAADDFDLASYPPRSPLVCRADWRPPQGKPGTSFDLLKAQALDAFGLRYAICNPLYGGAVAVSDHMGAAICRAMNDWVAAEWLARDHRLRASIVVPATAPDLAVEEIERLAPDKRFVQVLLPAAAEMLYGKRYYWPVWDAAVRHGLPVGLHAGLAYRYAPTSNGWPSHHLHDYVAASQVFEDQLLSLVTEGTFGRFPALKVVLIESGVTWLPGFLWRHLKTWRGTRPEVPWVDRPPTEIIRDQVRLTMQPFDAPPDPEVVAQVIDQLGSDEMLLFATDYPHWQFDGMQATPAGIPPAILKKAMQDNPLATYPRLRETAS